jgi:uncharacterized protein
MSPEPALEEVVHNEAAGRFEVRLAEGLVRCDYRWARPSGFDNKPAPAPALALVHTEVPPALQGRGLAGRVVQAAFDHARVHGLKIQPRCSYVLAWLQRHPQARALIDSAG